MGRFGVGRARLLVLLAALAAAVSSGFASASAQSPCSGKCALGALALTSGGGSPVSVGAGSTTSFTFTLTNESTQQSLGSADLTATGGFVLDLSPTPVVTDPYSTTATALPSGNTLELRNLSIPNATPSASVTVTFEVTAPCAGGSFTWTLLAKQANNFNGNPGNNFVTDTAASQLTVAVSGGCTLSFVAEPTNAVVSTAITTSGFSTALNSSSGSPVEVAATDGEGVPIPGVQVALSLAPGGGSGSLSGVSSGPTNSSGDASFPGISITQTGYYQLEANATNATGFPTAYSNSFQITTNAAPCIGSGSCNGSINATNKTAGVSAGITGVAGSDILSLGLGGFQYSCPGYTTVTGSIGVDVWTATKGYTTTESGGTYDVIIDVPKAEVTASPNNGASFYEICYASTAPFPGGSLVCASTSPSPTPTGCTLVGEPLIPGSPDSTYIGLLPECPSQATASNAPCTLSQTKKGGDVLVEFLGAPGDFWGST